MRNIRPRCVIPVTALLACIATLNSSLSVSYLQAITALKKGAYLLKYGRRGKPKFCPFRLSTVSILVPIWMENLTNSPSLVCVFFFVCEGIEEFTISIIFLSCFHSANIKATKPYFFMMEGTYLLLFLGLIHFLSCHLNLKDSNFYPVHFSSLWWLIKVLIKIRQWWLVDVRLGLWRKT